MWACFANFVRLNLCLNFYSCLIYSLNYEESIHNNLVEYVEGKVEAFVTNLSQDLYLFSCHFHFVIMVLFVHSNFWALPYSELAHTLHIRFAFVFATSLSTSLCVIRFLGHCFTTTLMIVNWFCIHDISFIDPPISLYN